MDWRSWLSSGSVDLWAQVFLRTLLVLCLGRRAGRLLSVSRAGKLLSHPIPTRWDYAPWRCFQGSSLGRASATSCCGKDWDPAADAFSRDALAPLTSDVRELTAHMCALDPGQRVTTAVAAQMLKRLAANAHADHQALQPEPEPVVTIDGYKGGELCKLWQAIHKLLSQNDAGDLQQHAVNDLQAVYDRLERSSQPRKLVEEFHKLLHDVANALQPRSRHSRIQRLSSILATRGSMDDIYRRVDRLRAALDDFQAYDVDRKLRWREQRSKQRELFVSEVSETFLELETMDDEDCIALLGIVEAELSTHKADYTEDQLVLFRRAREDIVQYMGFDILATTSEWFIPWHELAIDNFIRVGSGGFGNVYRVNWLDSEMVVKLLNGVGAGSEEKCSFAKALSSYLTTPRRCIADPDNHEERKKVREMFVREASIWFGLSHSHVVRLS